MTTDQDIKTEVEQELQWDARLDASDIGVSVRDQVVALSGYVHAYSHKLQAEHDAKQVAGVQGVANDIEVKADARLDMEIARDAVAAIAQQLPVSCQTIKVIVDHGTVRLEGSVDWDYQRRRAVHALDHIRGVRGIESAISIKSRGVPANVRAQIQAALKRSALVEANRIGVEADGAAVTLHGKARTWREREEVERAAWMAPGVTRVDNHIQVGG
jgi:osmotically-inducible protein OsmY